MSLPIGGPGLPPNAWWFLVPHRVHTPLKEHLFSGSMNTVICSAVEKHLLTYPDTAVNSAVFARVTVESSRHTNLGSPVTIGCIS